MDASGIAVNIDELPGGRFRFQFESLSYLLRRAHEL
jgi:hypothetical protein